MRVAIDTSYATRGASGTAVYIEQLIAALEADGVAVVRLRQPLRSRRGGRNKLRSAANVALDLAWTRELLPRAAERAKADVLHHPLPARSPTRIPQVVTVHDVAFARHPEDFDPVWRRLALRSHRAAVAQAGAVVAVSETTARDAIAWLRAPAERIVVAPHGPGQELAVDERPPGEHWLYVGDDEPRKNVAGLLEAYARYRRTGGAMPLVLAGAAAARADAGGRALAGGAADAPVRGVPRPDAAELAGLHARAIALVHPSRDEGFGLTVLEAMSTGTPVIAARNAAIEELAGEAALIVDDWALAEAMQRVERDERLQQMMGAAGRHRAAAFSWQRSAKAHVKAYTLARDSR
ncbi:MAG TPA: glycosyltransferase family 1 protein [Thermoleophilaceae bacterium]